MTEALITLVSVVAVLLGSPGPAPLALAAVGASFGARKGLPFLFGILSGLTIAIAGASLGLSALFAANSYAKNIIQVIGVLYIVYVAFKIATAPVMVDENAQTNIPSFAEGFVFSLLNPKAYAAFFAIFSQFLLPMDDPALAYFLTALVCMLVAVIVDSAWLILGGALKPIFSKPLPARILRVCFGLLMVLAVAWAFYGVS